jgi:uncharacterized membrane protein
MIVGRGKAHGRVVWICFLVVFAVTGLAGESATKAPPARHYRIIELPLRPLHLSNSGEVVGTIGANRAAIWSERGGLQPLAIPGGFSETEARGSSGKGHVVGIALNNDHSKSSAFIYESGKMTLLPGDGSKALAVNDSGTVVGESKVKGKIPTTPVVWKAGTITDLGACCGGVASAINSSDQVVGYLYDQQGRYRAFRWDQAHGVQYLGEPDVYSSAVAINDSGHVVIQEFEKGAYLYKGEGKMIRLVTSDGNPADVRGLNNADVVVGGFGPFADASKAFLWDEKQQFHDLNDLIPASSGWKLESAYGINDLGQIIGVGDFKGKEDVGFLLVEEKGGKVDGGRDSQ